MTHWKTKIVDVNWIGTHVLPEGKDLVVEITAVKWDEQAKVMGQMKPSFVAHFGKNQYFDKPMLLNKTNLKRLAKITGTNEFESWGELNITVVLCQEMDKAIGGGKDWALRIKAYDKPILTEKSANFEVLKDGVKNKKFSIDKIKQRYSISAEVEALLNE
jgi:hypothetical protein